MTEREREIENESENRGMNGAERIINPLKKTDRQINSISWIGLVGYSLGSSSRRTLGALASTCSS